MVCVFEENIESPAATMSSVQVLREFINERITAVAGEIFTVFEQTIIQLEEEIYRQSKLLELTGKVQIQFHRTESQQQHNDNQKEQEVPEVKVEEGLAEVPVTDGGHSNDNSYTSLRDLTTRQLTAAAVEIFSAFERTVVRCQEDIDRQHRLLEIIWKPQIKLHRTELPQYLDCRKKQLVKQETNSCLDHQEPEPPKIKEEEEEEPGFLQFTDDQGEPEPPQIEVQEDLGSSQNGEQLILKFESETIQKHSAEELSDLTDTEEVLDTEQILACSEELRPTDSETAASTSSEKQQELVGVSDKLSTEVPATPGTSEDDNDVQPDAGMCDLPKSTDGCASDEDFVYDGPRRRSRKAEPASSKPRKKRARQRIRSTEDKPRNGNYCYLCKTAFTKIARHLKTHAEEEPDIAEAFSFPLHSKQRKKLLEKLRIKGNYEHNKEVLKKKDGFLKVQRRTTIQISPVNISTYVYCAYCKGLFTRTALSRHSRRCPSKTAADLETCRKARFLDPVEITESAWTQAISPGAWKILKDMRKDEVGSLVRSDFLILQLCQYLYDKYASDPTKFEYVRLKLRQLGRLLMTLIKEHSIFNFEDAMKPENFDKVVASIKTMAHYDKEKKCYHSARLALNLGRSLVIMGEMILRRATVTEDKKMRQRVEIFIDRCTKEWARLYARTAPTALTKPKCRPSSLAFAEDARRLHLHLEKKSSDAVENLKEDASPNTYEELAMITLAQIITFNGCAGAGEVSNMTLELFKKRDRSELREDEAADLSPFERKLAGHLSRVVMPCNKGKKATVLLPPEVVSAATLLVEKRITCKVHKNNPFLFARPHRPSRSRYRGHDCFRKFAYTCGAKNPEHLRSIWYRKYVATLSQIQSLKDNELNQLSDFLGHSIRVDSDFYRRPEATLEMAKISKLLHAMEKGSLAEFKGKSLDEIEIEDEFDPELDEGELVDEGDDDGIGDGDEAKGVFQMGGKRKRMEPTQDKIKDSNGKRKRMEPTQDEMKDSTGVQSRRALKLRWSRSEMRAVLKHFEEHISQGRLATVSECERCRLAEIHTLKDRTARNIRDFVRNRGVIYKKTRIL